MNDAELRAALVSVVTDLQGIIASQRKLIASMEAQCGAKPTEKREVGYRVRVIDDGSEFFAVECVGNYGWTWAATRPPAVSRSMAIGLLKKVREFANSQSNNHYARWAPTLRLVRVVRP